MFFFFNDTATTVIYTLSLHDALPIFVRAHAAWTGGEATDDAQVARAAGLAVATVAEDPLLEKLTRSEEHTSELQSQSNLVCRLLLEKKKKNQQQKAHNINIL